jgi:hypothetical protein
MWVAVVRFVATAAAAVSASGGIAEVAVMLAEVMVVG